MALTPEQRARLRALKSPPLQAIQVDPPAISPSFTSGETPALGATATPVMEEEPPAPAATLNADGTERFVPFLDRLFPDAAENLNRPATEDINPQGELYPTVNKETQQFVEETADAVVDSPIAKAYRRADRNTELDIEASWLIADPDLLMDDDETIRRVKEIQDRRRAEVGSSPKETAWYEDVAGLLGGMEDPIQRGLAGAATGAVIGAPTGPGAIATAGTGFKAGSLTAWAQQGAGAIFVDLIEDGVSPTKARAIAAPAGLAYGGIEALQFGRLAKHFPMPDVVRKKLIGATQGLVGKIATKVSKRIAKRQPNVVGRGTGKTAKAAIEISANTGVQVFQEINQELLQLGSSDLGAVWEKGELGRDELLEPYWENVVGVFEVTNALAILSGASYGVGKGLQRRANNKLLKNLESESETVEAARGKAEVRERLGITEDMTRAEALSYLGDLTPDEMNERLGGDEEAVQGEAQEEAQEEGISQVELENMRDEIRAFRSLGDEDKKNALRILDEVTAAGDRKDFSDFHSKFDRYREQDRAGRDTTVRKNARISFIRAEGEVGFEADLMDSGGNPTGSRVTVEAGGRGTLAKITDKNNTVVKTLNQSSYADVIEMLQGGTEQGSLIVNEDNIELDRELNQGPLGPEATPEQGKRKRRRNQWVGKDKDAGVAETVELEGPEIGKDVSASVFLKNELGRAKRTNDLQERRDIMRGLQERIVNDDGLTQELLDLAVSKGMGPEAATPMPELDTESIARTKATREAVETRESEQRQLMGIPEPTSTPRPPSAMQEMESVVGTPLKEEVEEIDGGSGGPRTYSEGEPVPEPVQIGSSLPASEGAPAANIKDSEVSRPRRASGHNVVVGKNVKDARTLGHAVEPLRNTRSEWTYLVIRDKDSGEILGIDAHSWLLPGQTMGMEQILEARGGDKRNDKKIAEQMRQRIARLKSRTKTTGTLTIDVVHNHPSGTATPSDTDITTNSEFVEFIDTIEGAEFGEHTIIDTGEATSIDRNGEWRLYDIYSNEELYTSERKEAGEEDTSKDGRAERREQDPLYGAYRRNEGLESLFRTFGDAKGEGQKIGDYKNAEIGKYLKNDQGELGLAVIIDSRSNLRSAIPFNIGLLEDDDSFKVWARNRRAEHGGRNLVVYYGADDAESQLGLEEFEQRVQSKIESGDIYDAVYTEGRSARGALEEARGSLAPPLPVGADDDTASVRAVIREEIEDDGVLAAATEGKATTPETLDAASKVVDEANEEVVPATRIPKKVKGPFYKLLSENENPTKEQDKPYPLFVFANEPFPVNEWFAGKIGPKQLNADGTEYLDKDGQPRVGGKLDKMAFRPGVHASDAPVSTHLGGIGVKKGTAAYKRIKAKKKKKAAETGQPIETAWYRKPWQVWYEVEVGDDVNWQEEANRRGTKLNADGTEYIEARLAHITEKTPEGGHYSYKTNPNMKGHWIISGEMRMTRKLEVGESPDDIPDLPTLIDNENLAWKVLDNQAMDILEVWYPEKFSQMEGVTKKERAKKARAKKKRGSLREDVDRPGLTPPPGTEPVDAGAIPESVTLGDPMREANFRKWFKSSAVSTPEGAPIVFYHGTRSSRPFEEFGIKERHPLVAGEKERSANEMGYHFGPIDQANWMALAKKSDNEFAPRPQVFPVYLSIQNPLRVEDKMAFNALGYYGVLDRIRYNDTDIDMNDPKMRNLFEDASKAIRKLGYEHSQAARGPDGPLLAGFTGNHENIILQKALQRAGYDGLVYLNRGEGVQLKGTGENITASQIMADPYIEETYREGTDQEFLEVFDASDAYIAFEPTQVKSATGNRGTFSDSEASILREDTEDIEAPSSYIWPNESYGTDEKGIAPKPAISTAPKHLNAIDELKAEYPNPLTDKGSYNKWFSKIVGSKNKKHMGPPAQAIEWSNAPDTVTEYLKTRLRPEMQAAADEGLSYATERKKMYHGGEMTVHDTAHHVLWNILSTGISPYFQESGYLDTLTEGKLDRFYALLDVAIDSEGEKVKVGAWRRWMQSAIPKGSPGRSTTANVNRFYETFLPKATAPIARGEFKGEVPLILLHEWLSDPSLSGKEIRRRYFKAFKDAGMDNKLVSFFLLTSGHDDLLVLDRVQTRNMWGGQTGLVDFPPEFDPYEDGMSRPGHLSGPRGIAVYEALEEAMAPSIIKAYADIGRPESGSLAQFHWESYSIAGQMAVAHSTLGTSIDVNRGRDIGEAIVGRGPIQGKYNTYQTGFSYEPTAEGKPRFYYAANDGFTYILDRDQFDDFQKTLKRQATTKRGGKGLLPEERVVPHGFKITEEERNEEGKQLNYLERLELEEPGAESRFTKALRKATPNRVQTSERLSLNYPPGLREDVEAPSDFDTVNYAPSEVLTSDKVALDREGLTKITEALSKAYGGYQVEIDRESFEDRAQQLGRNPDALYGFVDQDESTVYINPSMAKADTPIHQFGHIWVQQLQQQDAPLYDTAIDLVRDSPYYERASRAGYGAFAEEEALVQLIGERGADIIERDGVTRRQQGLVKRILSRIDGIIQNLFGRKPSDIDMADMTLGDFVDVAASAVIENRPIKTAPGIPGDRSNFRQHRAESDRLSFGGKLFHTPVDEVTTIAQEYVEKAGVGRVVNRRVTRVASHQGKAIADAYEGLTHEPETPEVMQAYRAMADETMAQYRTILGHGYQVELWKGDGEPYENSPAMMEDLRENKHMYVFSTEEGYGETAITDQERSINPLLELSGYNDAVGSPLLINDVFRFVHDFFGHAKRGNGFGAIGEENAWDAHSQMYSDMARRAMTTETRGQNSWVNFGPHLRKANGKLPLPGDPKYIKIPDRPFADQKNSFFPDEIVFPERHRSRVLMEDVDPLKSDEDPSFQETFERFFDRYNIANTEAGVEAEPTEAPADPERAQPLGSEELSFPKTLESAGRPAPQDESRYYIPKSNAETRANVIKAFNKGGDVAVETLMKESESAESTAAAIFLHAYHMDRAGKAPDEESRNQELEKAVNVAAEASERLKDAGQRIQAASMLGMLDPDTIGLFVQRRIDRLNRKEGLGEVTTLADKAAQSKLGKALGLDKSREKRILTAEANKRLKILATKAQVLTDLGADSEALQGALDDLVENQQLSPEQVDQIGDFRTKVRNHLDSGEEVAEVGRSASKEPTMGWRKVLRTKVANRSSEARERLRDMGVLRAGIPADAMADLVAIGIEKMFRLGEGYSSWEQEMRSDLAMEMTKGDLHKIYDAAQKEYGETKKEARREYAQLKKMDEFLEKVAADPGLQESADIAALVEAVGSLGNLAEGARTEVGQEIQSMLRRLEPRRFTEYWTTFLHIGRLLSFKTPLRNILGNALMYEAERMNMMMAASIDRGVSAVTGADRRVMYVGRASSILSPVDFIRGVPKYGITPRGLAENFAATNPELAEGMRAGWMGASPAGLPTTAELPEGLTFDKASEDYKHLNRLLKPFYAMTGGLEGAMGAQLRGFDFAAYMRAYNTVIKEQAHLAAKNEKIVFDDSNLKEAWINNWTSKADANIHEAADEYARYVTFQDESFLAGLSISAKKLMNMDREFIKPSKDGKPQLIGGVIKRPHSLMAGEYILPYPRVPANLLNRGLAYSPAGFLKGALQLASGARQVEGGDYREGLLSITRSLIGMGMGALVYKLAELGLVSGSEKDESWAAQEVRRQVTGEGRNQINSTGIVRWVESGFDPKAAGKRKGDNFVTYDWAQPLALSAAFAVNAEQSMSTHGLQKKKHGLGGAKVGSALVSGLKGSFGVIEDQPMLQGIRTLFRSYGDDSGSSLDGLIRVAESVPASFVPVMVNNVTKYLDNDRKITRAPDSHLHTAINKAIARIPFMSDGLTKMYKTLGEDVPSEAYAQGNNTFFNVFLNPSFITEYNPDPIATMLLEPYEETRDTSTLPKIQGRSLRMGGETFILETEDRATMQRIMAGHLTRAMKREAKNDPRTPAGKEAQIERLVAKVNASADQAKGWFARNRMADYLGGYDSSPEVRRKINKAKKRYKYQGKR